MRVSLHHTTRFEYSAQVLEAVMEARMGPLSDDHQQWSRFELRPSIGAAAYRYTDGFGNAAHLITLFRPHRTFEVVTVGEVLTLLSDPFSMPGTPPPPLRRAELADYLPASPLVPRHPTIDEMAGPLAPSSAEDTFGAVQRLMELVHGRFSYRQQATSVGTTIGEVLEGGVGVCQDFAHVLIGLCRSISVPARYVSGYIVPAGHSSSGAAASGPVPERGADASHAWIEAWTPTHGWRGFDPTNNLLASEHHVKMAIGRDYRDVAPTRGTFRGVAEEHLSVKVDARPA